MGDQRPGQDLEWFRILCLSVLQWWLLIAEGRYAERHHLPGNRKLIGRERAIFLGKKRDKWERS